MSRKKINLYLILIGIGIGIILSSLFNILNPTIKYKEYSESDIKRMARELGMVDLKEKIIEEDKGKDEKKVEDQKNKDFEDETEDKIIEDKTDNRETKNIDAKKNQEYIEFEIKRGEKSEVVIEHLYEQGLIEDVEDFTKEVKKEKAGRKIQYGKHRIPIGADYKSIIEILIR